jgi:hypothetical protein
MESRSFQTENLEGGVPPPFQIQKYQNPGFASNSGNFVMMGRPPQCGAVKPCHSRQAEPAFLIFCPLAYGLD